MEVRYTVSAIHRPSASSSSRDSADVFIDWLRNGHAQDVIASGASWAEVVELQQEQEEEESVVVQARYGFPSMERFDEYVTHYAPKLKAEGLAKFGPDSGRKVEFNRFSGQLMDSQTVGERSLLVRRREGDLRYGVRAYCATREARDYFVRWLTDGHARALIEKGGALWYEIVAESHPSGEAEEFRVEAMYSFSGSSDFEHYLNEVAPHLRAESQAAFGPGTTYHSSIRFERQRMTRLFTQTGDK
eukprot:gb/GECG01014694.1/.p1 GENE.gb/GECG01014694.1/~~gb/GECG01014694.1/.p1  ORF type:complete len:245 (+),score=26.97 gb/GECG01014694.1/:1-735(+)